ncbi:MAG: sodium-dependent transporter [Oscillospiraceae bacterium]|nr:sodium-dependent transporter [Oscillospiraceae bacterium]
MGNEKKSRGSFTGGIGFVLAAAGSAVGLGNLWRFPYLAAQYGGGIFILVYIIIALTFGFALLSTEIAIGRKTGKSPLLAYGAVDKRFGFLGILASLVPVIILPYYCIIGGWVIKYMVSFVSGGAGAAAGEAYFGGFIGDTWPPLLFFAIFLGLTAAVILLGVNKGIEKLSKFLMPVLLLMCVGISIYVLTIPGAMDGLKYYLLPDFSKFSLTTVCAATGQVFFSMSIAMGIMVAYGSYTKPDTNLSKSVNQIEIFDTVVAILAGLMVVPAVYVFSGEAGTKSSGAGLMFQTLPKVFEQMPGGAIIGAVFFIMVFFAALTSSISVMEAIVSSIIDKFHVKRWVAVLICLAITVAMGIPISLGFGVWSNFTILGMDLLTFFDYLSNSVLMPIVALITCILIGWVVGPEYVTTEMTRNGERLSRKTLYNVIIKFIAPIMLVLILVTYSLAQFGIIVM